LAITPLLATPFTILETVIRVLEFILVPNCTLTRGLLREQHVGSTRSSGCHSSWRHMVCSVECTSLNDGYRASSKLSSPPQDSSENWLPYSTDSFGWTRGSRRARVCLLSPKCTSYHCGQDSNSSLCGSGCMSCALESTAVWKKRILRAKVAPMQELSCGKF